MIQEHVQYVKEVCIPSIITAFTCTLSSEELGISTQHEYKYGKVPTYSSPIVTILGHLPWFFLLFPGSMVKKWWMLQLQAAGCFVEHI